MGNCCGGIQLRRRQKIPDDAEVQQEVVVDKKRKNKNNNTKKVKDDNGDDEMQSKFGWETQLLEDKLMRSGYFTHAAIVDAVDATLKAASPRDFIPDPQGMSDILAALNNNDVTQLAERGIVLHPHSPGGATTAVYTPGKVDEGKAIYGSAAEGHGQASEGQGQVGGGCAVYKTKRNVLVVVYDKDPDVADRLATEVVDYMLQNDR